MKRQQYPLLVSIPLTLTRPWVLLACIAGVENNNWNSISQPPTTVYRRRARGRDVNDDLFPVSPNDHAHAAPRSGISRIAFPLLRQ